MFFTIEEIIILVSFYNKIKIWKKILKLTHVAWIETTQNSLLIFLDSV